MVKSIEDIKYNMQVIDSYLNEGVDPEYTYALNLIKRGICFVVDDSSGRNKFYPSRFIGYVLNSRDKHDSNTHKDGKVTNPGDFKHFRYKAGNEFGTGKRIQTVL